MDTSRKRKQKRKNSTAKADLGAENYTKDQTLVAWIADYQKRSKTEKYSTSPSLPKDLIYDILVLLPATILHKIMRYVCKDWNDIISDPIFIRAHIVCSSRLFPSVVLQDQAEPQWGYCLNTTDLQLSMREIPFPATILDSCDGLLLLHDKTNPHLLHVMNLRTREKLNLPPLTRVCILEKPPYAILAYTPSSRQYKVVVVCASAVAYKTTKLVNVLGFKIRDITKTVENVHLMVCTVAVDKTWRTIDCNSITMSEHAYMSRLSLKTLMVPPICRAGFVYWYPYLLHFGLSIDVDSETMYQLPGLEDFSGYERPLVYKFVSKTGVGLMNANDVRACKMWEMVYPKSGTWVRGTDFDARDMYCRLQSLLHPCKIGGSESLFSSENGNLLLSARVDDKYNLFCYNRKIGYVWSLPLQWPTYLDLPNFHINSLLSLKNIV